MICKRVGLLGGTFDPVHTGHLQMARAALKEFNLDTVTFVPAGHPPHKDKTSISPFEHRVAMLNIACADEDYFQCNEIEGSLPTPSYTIDTLIELFSYYGSATQLFFLIGVDAFIEILTWKAHQDILKSVSLIVFGRRGMSEPDLISFLTELGYSGKKNHWQGKHGQEDIFLTQYIPDNVSSSSIRKNIRNGYDCAGLLPENVFNYIMANRLYC